MSFFTHTNTDVAAAIRAHGTTDLPVVMGQFRNRETDTQFEFAGRRPTDAPHFAAEMPHLIAVHGGTRYARVMKTVAYVVVDEDADGQPVIEKWAIKGHRDFDLTGLDL